MSIATDMDMDADAGGETREAPRTLLARDPATGVTLGEVQATAPEQIEQVVTGVARVQPLWALLRVVDRARYMRRMAQAIVDEFDALTETIGREQGRPRAEVATMELLSAIDALNWIAQDGAQVLGGRRVGTHRSLTIGIGARARVAYEPYGTIGVIGAGSAPFAQPLSQIAGALLAGNGVVFKPARRACLAGEAIMRVLGRAGLPEGLVAIAHGGAQVGVALARAPVGKVLFTGSPAVGREVARECVSREREVTVELGGKDAMLVLADADLARAVDGALWAGCAGAGQARGAVERVYVAREVAELFVEQLVARARGLSVGDPAGGQSPAGRRVQVGPLASERRLAHVSELVEEAVAQGARLRCGGPLAQAPSGCSGAFYAPAVVTGATHEMRLMREPLDGPVLAVVSVDSVEQAIALANDCEYGLGASVWTADRYRGTRIARELRAGMVWLNDHLPGPMLTRGPWGAASGAGLGKTLGETGLRACAQEKLIAWSPSGLRGLWWGPYDETTVRAARAVARLRSGRESDRERAWRRGGPAIVRVGARMLGRGVPR
ncbi:MAG TPA: aldehyde dehydrogenase family protein [Solirubrobacteraceae bacterium]|jgi:succinate-semialdehyde dehydrogenase/glutarate-semialdehyde dehydrogenase|nr:aldehyde dehydrogenase family protein [Solirubrobacteraceae bacterium]